jgi:hypothetical protein
MLAVLLNQPCISTIVTVNYIVSDLNKETSQTAVNADELLNLNRKKYA